LETNLKLETKSPEPEKIKSMFARVAKKYDRANNYLSFWIHHLWRKKLVNLSQVKPGQKVLDCATGTGDLAFEFLNKVGSQGQVIGTDFCPEMLEYALLKSKNTKLPIQFQVADVLNLPFEDHTFDFTSISFGIRNVRDPIKALQEMARTTRPGGKVLVLEFGQVQWPVFHEVYDFYSRRILPQVGGLITGDKEAYKYLQNSSAQFPCRDEFLKLMDQSQAFDQTQYIPLSGGIAYIYQGRVKA